MISSAFWRGQRVFVTGHTGFAGAWLSLALARLNARATGYAQEPATAPNLYDLAGVSAHIKDIRGDIRDLPRLAAMMRAAEPDIVMHIAAPMRPRGDAVDLIGAINALEAARACASVRAALIVGDDATPELCADARGGAMRDGAIKVLHVDSGALIGGGDFAPARIVPEAFRALSAGRAPQIAAPGRAQSFTHVLDAASGWLMLIEAAMADDSRAGGGGRFTTITRDAQNAATLVARFGAAFDGAARSCEDNARPRACGVSPDATAAPRHIPGWSPLLDFAEAVEWTAEWYRALAHGEDAARITAAQLDAYLGQRVRLVSPFQPRRDGELRAVGF